MAFKFIAFALLIAAANAGLLPTVQVAQPALLHQRLIQPQLIHQQVAQPALIQQRLLQPQLVHQQVAQPILQHVAQPALIQQRLLQPQLVHQQVAQPILTKQVEEYDPNPQYSYAYDVQDSLTGDSKSQQESRSGDVVQGQYSLLDADGLRRTVDYTADPINGFNAVVSREHPTVVKSAVVAQPALLKTAVVGQPQLVQQQLLH